MRPGPDCPPPKSGKLGPGQLGPTVQGPVVRGLTVRGPIVQGPICLEPNHQSVRKRFLLGKFLKTTTSNIVLNILIMTVIKNCYLDGNLMEIIRVNAEIVIHHIALLNCFMTSLCYQCD